MTTLANSDLQCLNQGTRLLGRHPWMVAGLGLLGAALSALAPFIQLRAGLPDDLVTGSAVICAAVIPLELFFIPRFLLQLDAESGGNPLNAVSGWKVRFEERWLRAFVAKAFVGLMIGIGLSLFILPGLLTLAAFGWAPLRVLLKGEGLRDAFKGSVRMMVLSWKRAALVTLVMGICYFLAAMAVAAGVGHFLPDPTLRQRILHPALWVGNFLSTIFSLWLSTCFLALFRRLDV